VINVKSRERENYGNWQVRKRPNLPPPPNKVTPTRKSRRKQLIKLQCFSPPPAKAASNCDHEAMLFTPLRPNLSQLNPTCD
jgi:hypothetical protein